MKKIGILTLNGNFNVGNKLQNYALKKYLEKLGFEVETIWFTTNIKKIKHFIKHFLKFTYKYKNYFHLYNFSKYFLNVKYFKNKNISFKYDYIIVGSDQVWNYNFLNFSDDYFLTFSSKEKNVAYAASIGVSNIPKKYQEQYIQGINNINNISVRENEAKEILENITGRKDIEVLIDPTMLLSSTEWDIMAKKPNIKLGRYIFAYFLGKLNDNYYVAIKNFAKKNNCKIINYFELIKSGIHCGPQEFLYLEKNAFLICTDSFHSSVFAILNDKPFVIFNRDEKDRDNMNSRIDTLLEKFKIADRKFTGSITDKNVNHNYEEAFKILEKEREKSLAFLTKALAVHGEKNG